MGKSQVKKGVSLAAALCQDISGNILSGNEVRALGYVKALGAVLSETLEMIEAGSDVRKEMTFTRNIQAALERMEEEHKVNKFDGERMAESFEKYEKAGYTPADFGRGISADEAA
jgi:hypothetical protein